MSDMVTVSADDLETLLDGAQGPDRDDEFREWATARDRLRGAVLDAPATRLERIGCHAEGSNAVFLNASCDAGHCEAVYRVVPATPEGTQDRPTSYATDRDAPASPLPPGVLLDRMGMALQHALTHLRAEVPNHDPVRVEARKALDAWIEWSVDAALAPSTREGDTP